MNYSDGTRGTHGIDVEERSTYGENGRWYPQYAYVVSVHPKDDPKNISKKRVECDVVLKEYDLPIFNVPVIQFGDGFTNYDEWYPQAAEKNVLPGVNKAQSKKTNFDNTDGDEVVVMFINGDCHRPVIVGSLGHPMNSRKATIEDGNRRRSEINGVRKTINKNGEFTLETRVPNQYEVDTLKQDASKQKGVSFEVLKDNAVKLKIATDEAEKFIEASISPVDKTMYISLSDQFSEIIDYGNKKHTIKYDAEGEIEQTVDWASKKMIVKNKSGDGQIVVDFSSKKIQLQFDNTEIGKAALEYMVKGDTLKAYIENILMNVFNNHSHVGNLGYSVSIPTPQLTAPLPATWSTKNKVE